MISLSLKYFLSWFANSLETFCSVSVIFSAYSSTTCSFLEKSGLFLYCVSSLNLFSEIFNFFKKEVLISKQNSQVLSCEILRERRALNGLSSGDFLRSRQR